MATYKVSYVIKNSDQTGGILNLEDKPEVGDTIQIGGQALEVKDVFELIPPRRASTTSTPPVWSSMTIK